MKRIGWLEDYFLGPTEEQAKAIIKKVPRKAFGVPEASNPMQVLHRERQSWDLLQEIKNLREIIGTNKIPQEAIYVTALIMILSYDLGLSHPIYAIRGWKKGGPKKEPAFNFLVKYAWQNSKRKTSLSMWRFLKKKIGDAGNTINHYDFVYEEEKNRITVYFNNGKSKDIGFRSFQRYVKNFKEELKKKSQ
jgi:hypothetical protein